MNPSALKRFQFSLKTALIAIAIFSLAFGLFRIYRNDAIRRKEAVSYLRTRGVQVIASDGSQSPELFQSFWDDPYKASYLMEADNAQLSEQDSKLLSLFPEITIVFMRNTKQGDAEALIRHIENPRNVRELSFAGSDIGTATFVELKRFASLETLCFLKCNMSSAEFSEFPCLPDLEHLRFGYSQGIDDGDINALADKIGSNIKLVDLDYTDVSDASLALICKRNTVTSIHFEGTSVDGSGLAALSELSSLKMLDLSETKVQPEKLMVLLRLKSPVPILDLTGTSIRSTDIPEIHQRWGLGNMRLDPPVSSPDSNSSSADTTLENIPGLPGPPGPK